MDLEAVQQKIRMIMQQKYGVRNVEFGVTNSGKYTDCPYVSFSLRNKDDKSKLDRILDPMQKRVLSAKLGGGFTDRRGYVTTFLGKDLERMSEAEDKGVMDQEGEEYWRAVLVVKKEGREKKMIEAELAKVFYEALDKGIGIIRFRRYLGSKGSFNEDNAKKRTIDNRGCLERNRNRSYWGIIF